MEEGDWGANGDGSHSGGGYDDGQSSAPLGEGGGVQQDLRRLLANSRREWGASYRTILAGMLDEEGNF